MWITQPKFVASIGIVALILGLAGVGTTFYFGLFGGGFKTALELRNTSSLALAAPTGPLSERVRIFLDDEEVQQLWLATFKLVNTGDVDIGKGDFGQPIRFSAGSVGFEELIPGQTEPPDLNPQYAEVTKTSFLLEPLLLKTGEALTFSIVSSAKLDDLIVSARIKGLQDIPVISALQKPTSGATERTQVLIALFLVLFGVLAAVGASAITVVSWKRAAVSTSTDQLQSMAAEQSTYIANYVFGEVLEWKWEGLDAHSPAIELDILLVNMSVHDVTVEGHHSAIRIDSEPCGLEPQYGKPIKLPKANSRILPIRQPLTDGQAGFLRDARDNNTKVYIGTNEFHLLYTLDNIALNGAVRHLLVGYKHEGAGGYRLVPGFSMKQ